MPTLRQENKELYHIWKSLKQRCNNSKHPAYHNYGGRGITYTDEWESFEGFYNWAKDYYQYGLDLDRIDNNKNYEPNNCRFISRRTNVNNRRISVHLTVNGETKALTEWAEITKICRGTVGYWQRTHGNEYAEMRLKEALKNGYKYKDYSYGNTKRIKHLETGLEFNSFTEASKYFNLAVCTISNAIRCKRKTSKGSFIVLNN